MSTRLFAFVGGNTGLWRVTSIDTIIGEPILNASRLDIVPGAKVNDGQRARWVLQGITSNERYVVRSEREQLIAKQANLGRPKASHASLIP
ncbi:MAG: chlorite dismutase, partial [Roseiflexaceae bacterium]